MKVSQKIKYLTLLSMFLTSFFIVSCIPAKPEEKNFISVTGVASISKTPNRVCIPFVVFTKDKNLAEAKIKNDKIMKTVKELFTKYNIETKDITVERINIQPRFRYWNNGAQTLEEYEVTQNISVILTKIENYEMFLTDLLNAGIDRIANVSFSVGNMRELMDNARAAAVKAAEEKAIVMCNAANRNLSLGNIISITETPSRSNFNNYRLQNAKSYDEKEYSPIGQIEVTAEVTVVFELKN